MSKGYIAYCKDDKERKRSTSGGVFFTIARSVIYRGGIVYGAAFDEDFNVVHIRGTTIDDLHRMQGSKYVQSKKNCTFSSVKQDLLNGLEVMFCGTPCEIEGLLCFLNKDYEKLICMDFVCLGVPSPSVWGEYLSAFHKKDEIQNIVFKDKKYGWSNWSFTIYKKRNVFREPGDLNLYMQGYLQHLYIRPSCFECKFRNVNHRSDFTVADCWGVENIAPEMYDKRGVSMVLVNTEKGDSYFSSCSNNFVVKEENIEDLLKGNPHATQDIKYNSNRDGFFEYKKSYGVKRALLQFAQHRVIWKFYIKTIYWRCKALCLK